MACENSGPVVAGQESYRFRSCRAGEAQRIQAGRRATGSELQVRSYGQELIFRLMAG
jgi:hypothetical protein